MPAATMSKPMFTLSSFASGLGLAESKVPGSSYEKFETEAGTTGLRLRDVPVFRSGEFSNSMGDVREWTALDVQQMANNFGLLSDSGIFHRVPVRCDHFSIFSGGLEGQIGYHENVRAEEKVSPVDGETYTYLMADMVILKSEAVDNILSGLWTNRSAEIGPYRTNYTKGESRVFEPVLLGTAFVDIPAVEGLTFSKNKGASADKPELIMMEENMPQPKNSGEDGGQVNHSASAAPTHHFRIGSESVSDFAKVQKYIDDQAATITAQDAELTDLRTFKSEATTREREAFVTSLKEKNLITGPQAEQFSKLAATLNADAFEQFKAGFAGAEVNPILEKQGPSHQVAPGASADTPGSVAHSGQRDEAEERKAILREQVLSHFRANTPVERIESYACFRELKRDDETLTVADIVNGK